MSKCSIALGPTPASWLPQCLKTTQQGILIGSSPDLNSWTTHGIALTSRGTQDAAMVWAPSLVRDENLYYMFYTGVTTPQPGQYCRTICVASTTTPTNPASWQRNESVQFNVGGVMQSWFRPSHPGAVWNPNTWADCRDPHVFKRGTTWYMYYSGMDSDGPIVGVCTASSVLGPWTDQGAVLKGTSGFFENPFVSSLPDGTFIMSTNHAGSGQEFARSKSLTPVDGTPTFGNLVLISNTTKTPLPGWGHEFIQSTDPSYDVISAALSNYDIYFRKAWFVKETHGWMIAASPGREHLGIFSPKLPDGSKRFLQDFSIFTRQGYMYAAPMLKYESKKGVLISRSSDLVTWQDLGLAVSTRTPECQSMVWAPHVVEEEGTWYMFYTGVTTPSPGQWCQRICLATTTDPSNPSSWQRDYNVQFNVDGVMQSWFRPSHPGAVWTSTAWADCRDPMVLKHGNTWHMFYSGTDTDGGICGVATAPSLRGPWTDHGAVLKCSGIPESCFVIPAPDGSWVMVLNHAGGAPDAGIKTARVSSLVPVGGKPSFGDLRHITDTSAIPLRGWAHEFLPGDSYGCDFLSAALGYYEILFEKAWMIKEPWGWTIAASPTPVPTPPVKTGVSLSSTSLLADGATVYTITASCQDSNGGSDILDMRVMLNLDISTFDRTKARGYLAWGKTIETITYYGGSWTISPCNEGFWGFYNNDWGYQYITPLSCTTSVVGTKRIVTWTFVVNPAWGTAGPLSGNFVCQRVLDDARTGGGWSVAPGLTYSIVKDTVAPTGTVVINSGAAYTTSPTVTLTINTNSPDVDSMRFSNDNSSWSAWETFAPSRFWKLTAGDGTKTVYLQLRDKAGNIPSSFSDSIVLLSALQDNSIAAAKKLPDNSQVRLNGLVITATFTGFAYAADSTRGGIRLEGQFGATVGDVCEVVGFVRTRGLSGIPVERYIEVVNLSVLARNGTVLTTMMPCRSVGSGYGIDSVGMRVIIAGKVTVVDPKVFLLSDGSANVRVFKSAHGFKNGDFTIVTGIVEGYASAGARQPALRAL